MTWTTPRTWVTGEVLSSSNLNTHVRDNLAYLHGDAGAFTVGALPTFATFPFRRIDVGALAVTLPAGFGTQTLSPALSFASAFAAAPVIIASGYSAGLANHFLCNGMNSITTTGCTFQGSGGGNAPQSGTVWWHAIGQPA